VSLGKLGLGMARTHARHVMPRYSRTRNDFVNFCLRRSYGIRVGYPSARLLRSLPRRMRNRSRSRILIALTANRYYALSGIRAFHVGLNYWYVVPGRAAYGVLKVRHGRAQEVGIVSKSVTRERAAQRRLFRSMNAV